jgi:hypothetical protein
VNREGAPARTTVVITVWGAYTGDALTRALASVATQDRQPAVIVVDNASTPAVALDTPVSVMRSEQRLTLGAARNLGLAQCATDDVIFWDADDTMLPGTVGFLEDRLAGNQRLVAYGSAIVEATTGARHRWPRRWVAWLVRVPPLLALVDCVWSVFPTTGATVIRVEAARRAGGFADTESGEDWCLGAALAWQGRFGWSERPGRVYEQRSTSTWATHSGVRDQLRHAAAVRARLQEPGLAPRWLRATLPLLACAQTSAVAAHVLVAALRKTVHPRRA